MKSMDLNVETLDNIEAPLSDDFWYGVAAGFGAGVVVGTIIVLT